MAFGVQGFIFERENKRKKQPKLCLLGNDRSEKISCQRDFCEYILMVPSFSGWYAQKSPKRASESRSKRCDIRRAKSRATRSPATRWPQTRWRISRSLLRDRIDPFLGLPSPKFVLPDLATCFFFLLDFSGNCRKIH